MKKFEEQILKTFKINRFRSLRILNAFIFFMYLYWMLNLIFYKDTALFLIPLGLIFMILIPVKDQYNCWFLDREVAIQKSRKIYLINIVINFFFTIVTFINYNIFFPYVSSRNYGLTICGILILLSFFSFLKANRINKNIDKSFVSYQKYLRDRELKQKESKVKYV